MTPADRIAALKAGLAETQDAGAALVVLKALYRQKGSPWPLNP